MAVIGLHLKIFAKNSKNLLAIALLPLILIALPGCLNFIDSPFSDTLQHGERDLNDININRLGDMDADGKLRIAVFADSHENYKSLDRVIGEINNTPDVDFVANLGDVTNMAYNMEYDRFLDSYLNIRWPVFTVIGNHDSIGQGPSLFRKAFGPSNFYFESNDYRFIFWNSINIEHEKDFDPAWLVQTVQSSTKPVFIFSHVPFDDQERFHGTLRNELVSLVTGSHVAVSLNGHNHVYDFRTDSGTVIVQCARTEGDRWLLLDITSGGMEITRMRTGEQQWAAFKTFY